MRPAPKSSFDGTRRFEIRARLGEGACGVVYEAYDRERGARVALKTLSTVNAEALLVLKNEFRAVQDIQHPNLVQLGELIEDRGRWFFTMELVPGVDFLRWVRRDAPAARALDHDAPTSGTVARITPSYDEARLRAALVQLARGLEALHAAQKVHRDVKPSNVLVTNEGRVVVLDFGITRDVVRPSTGRGEGGMTGTLAYMSPEQAASEPIGPASDWYAVGVVLYEALTGVLPFQGSAHELLEQKVTREPAPPSELVPGVPADLDALCADLLRLDPEARPNAADVLRRLGAESDLLATSGQHAIFVGRRDELRLLHQAFDDARRGRGVAVLVEGESGVGKSYLVRHFTDRVLREHPETNIFFGRCFERESVPYKAVDGVVDGIRELLDELGDDAQALLPEEIDLLAQSFPVLASVQRRTSASMVDVTNPQELRIRVFKALRTLFDRIARRAPMVVVIDDLQWADADSLALLGELLRPPGEPRVLVVATIRSGSDMGERTAAAARAAMTCDVRSLDVTKLPTSDAEELVGRLLGPGAELDSERVRSIVAESKGHPLFVDELVRHGAVEGRGSTRVRLDDALFRRVQRLDPLARRLLEVIAVAGLPIAQRVAARAAALDDAQAFQIAAVLRTARFARTNGAGRDDRIEPYHDRVRESVVAHLDERQRRATHRSLAVALEAAPNADPEALANHWSGAGEAQRAFGYTMAGAKRAEQALAFDRAARLYARALELDVADAAQVRAIRVSLAEALTNAGRNADAAEVRLVLAADAPAAEALDHRRRAAEQLLCSGHHDRGVDLLRRVLGAMHLAFPMSPLAVIFYLLVFRLRLRLRGLAYREIEPAQRKARALARIDALRSAGSGFSMSDNARGAYFQTRALLVALDAGDPARILHALSMEICFNSAGGPPTRARTERLLASAEPLAERLGTPEALAVASTARGFLHFFNSEWSEARHCLTRAEELYRDRCIGYAFELGTARTMLYRALMSSGDLRELAARADGAFREVEAQGDRYASINMRATLRALVGLAADDVERVRGEVAQAVAWLAQSRFLVQHFFCWTAHTQVDLYCGDAAAAHARAVAVWPKLKRSLLLHVQSIRIAAYSYRARCAIALAATDAREREKLLAYALGAAATLERDDNPWAAAEATLLRGCVAKARGDVASARAVLTDAIAKFEALGMQLHVAAARRRLGAFLGGDEGAALVARADAWLEAQGVQRPDALARVFAP